jgi:hypothetical protein
LFAALRVAKGREGLLTRWRAWSFVVVLGAGGCGAQAGLSSPRLTVEERPVTRSQSRQHGASVFVHPSRVLANVSPLILGSGMTVTYNITLPGIASALVAAGSEATRWPGGKVANWYHWKTNSSGPGICSGHPNSNSTFDNFMQDVAIPAHLDVAITVNYGSNAECTGGGDPTEAAAWVAYANATRNYGVQWWTVGNEQWAAGALDLHSQPHSPTQYARIEASRFYPAMKAASPTPIDVCVGVQPKNRYWDPVVLARARYDCVEMHYYAQSSENISDSFLLYDSIPVLHGYLLKLKGELATAGHPTAPIYLGEIGSSTSPAGKQSQSIVQALFAGQLIGELVNSGIARATWHMGNGDCSLPSDGGEFAKSIYGWQRWGGAMIFADRQQNGCPPQRIAPETPLATARAYQVLTHFAHPGEAAVATTVRSSPSIRAYATTDAGGYAVMLLNLNETTSENVSVSIDGRSSGSGGTITTYDKTTYDRSKNNVWAGARTVKLRAWSGSFTISMEPWSMTVVETQ